MSNPNSKVNNAREWYNDLEYEQRMSLQCEFGYNEALDREVKFYIWLSENKLPKYRGYCSECGEGYDNEPQWKYNTKCELCGNPIPEHLIISKP